IKQKEDQKSFLVLYGATNALVMGVSFLSLYAISKTRTGAAFAIKELIGVPSSNILILILFITLLSGVISFFLTKFLAKFVSQKITSIDYSKVSVVTLVILVLIVFIVSKLIGLVVFAVATLTGIYCIRQGVRRTNMMGCLLIPTIIWYLF
ncbi:MAG: tripartite tricarboxylate transporter permease, partial [Nanoarchaeota archaeon]